MKAQWPRRPGGKLVGIVGALALLATGACIANPWVTVTPSPTPTPPPVYDVPLTTPALNPEARGRDEGGNTVMPTPGERIIIVTNPAGETSVLLPVVLPRDATLHSFSDPSTGVLLSDDGLVIPIRDIAGKIQMTLLATVRPLRGTGATAEGRIDKMELETAPVKLDLSGADSRVGPVSFQVKSLLKSLPEGAGMRIVISKRPNAAAMNAFTLAASRIRNRLVDIAFVVEVTKTRLVDGKDLGPGTVTFQVGRQWADGYARENIAVAVLADDGSVEILLTQFAGYTGEDQATFVAQTKGGVSTFGLVALENVAPTPTPTPSFYALNVSAYPSEYGEVRVEPPSPTLRYLEGTRVVLRSLPGQGNKFDRWEGDAAGSSTRLEVVMDSNKNISGLFSKLTFEVNADSIPRNGGTVTISPYLSAYDFGTRVTFTAEAYPGFVFRSWSGDASGTANPISLVIDGNKNVTANFTAIRYSFTTAVNPPGSGTVSPPGGAADIGTQISLFASPGEGWQFSSWSGNVPAGATENPLTITLDRDRNIVANFTRPRFNLTTQVFPTAGGSISPTGGTFEYGQRVTLAATPASEYLFNGWGGDITGSENPTTITITKDTRVYANFITVRYTLNISLNPFEGGFVAPNTSGVFPSGTVINLEARPSPGWAFVSWTGDIFSASRFITIQMNRNIFLTANFRFVPTPTPPPPPTPTPILPPPPG